MKNILKLGRSAVVLALLVFVSACTQAGTAVTSYSGDLGRSSGISKDVREAKIKRSRERAKKQRAARKAAFLKKRKAGRKDKSITRAERRKAKSKTRAKAKTRVKTKKTNRRAKNTKRKRIIRKASIKRSKTRRIKRSTNAFVGGRSKGITKAAPWKCVPGQLKSVISQVSKKFGRVTINSTHRSRGYNRKVGGKRRSYHLRCQAVDFRVSGNTRGLTRWLARHPKVGGFKRYRSGFYHIDTGPKRTW